MSVKTDIFELQYCTLLASITSFLMHVTKITIQDNTINSEMGLYGFKNMSSSCGRFNLLNATYQSVLLIFR